MRWVKRFRPHQTTAQRVMKKIARKEKMAKKIPKDIKTSKKSDKLSPDQYFVLCNGVNLKSIHDLAKHIEVLDDDIYNYHVNAEKNDFANWLSGVFEEHELAEKVRSAEDRHKTHVALLKHLAFKK